MDKQTFVAGYKACLSDLDKSRDYSPNSPRGQQVEKAWDEYVKHVFQSDPAFVRGMGWLLGGPRELVFGEGRLILVKAHADGKACLIIRPCEPGEINTVPDQSVFDRDAYQAQVIDTYLWFSGTKGIDNLINTLTELKEELPDVSYV